jgi:hypothetical protein
MRTTVILVTSVMSIAVPAYAELENVPLASSGMPMWTVKQCGEEAERRQNDMRALIQKYCTSDSGTVERAVFFEMGQALFYWKQACIERANVFYPPGTPTGRKARKPPKPVPGLDTTPVKVEPTERSLNSSKLIAVPGQLPIRMNNTSAQDLSVPASETSTSAPAKGGNTSYNVLAAPPPSTTGSKTRASLPSGAETKIQQQSPTAAGKKSLGIAAAKNDLKPPAAKVR